MSIAVKDVIKAQAHIGSLKSEAYPKTKKYRADVQKGIVIINPEMIAKQIEVAKEKIQKAKADGKVVLVACEKKMYADELAQMGDKLGVNYLNYKVPAGFLTNFETLKKRIDSMNSMAKFMETDAFEKLTKKEQLVHERKLKRVKKIYGGVKEMAKKPDLVIVVDAEMMASFINEIEKTKDIESVLIAGTDFSRRRREDSMILANVLAYKSIDFILRNILS